MIDQISLRGHREPMRVFRYLEQPSDATVSMGPRPRGSRATLELRHGEEAWTVDAHRPKLRIGRSTDNDVVIARSVVSRNHAEIVLRGEKFLLVDRSTNGTVVKVEDGPDLRACAKELVLVGEGSSFRRERGGALGGTHRDRKGPPANSPNPTPRLEALHAAGLGRDPSFTLALRARWVRVMPPDLLGFPARFLADIQRQHVWYACASGASEACPPNSPSLPRLMQEEVGSARGAHREEGRPSDCSRFAGAGQTVRPPAAKPALRARGEDLRPPRGGGVRVRAASVGGRSFSKRRRSTARRSQSRRPGGARRAEEDLFLGARPCQELAGGKCAPRLVPSITGVPRPGRTASLVYEYLWTKDDVTRPNRRFRSGPRRRASSSPGEWLQS